MHNLIPHLTFYRPTHHGGRSSTSRVGNNPSPFAPVICIVPSDCILPILSDVRFTMSIYFLANGRDFYTIFVKISRKTTTRKGALDDLDRRESPFENRRQPSFDCIELRDSTIGTSRVHVASPTRCTSRCTSRYDY